MTDAEFQKALVDYTIHISDNQTKMVEYQSRMTEAMLALGQQMTTMNRQHEETMATLSTQSQAIANILERVVQTTDRTEQMVARLLTRGGPDTLSH